MGKNIQNYSLMIAHSADTTEFVDVVNAGVSKFCSEHNKHNINAISIDVKDFNDAIFPTYSPKDTQDIVFDQFAGHPDIIIALIGARIGGGLKKELDSFLAENKQTFIYLYDGCFKVYSHWDMDDKGISDKLGEILEIRNKRKDVGYSKVFVKKEELITYIIDDLARFLMYRQKTKFELADKSYSMFAREEVDRYRNKIRSIISLITKENGTVLSEAVSTKKDSDLSMDRGSLDN